MKIQGLSRHIVSVLGPTIRRLLALRMAAAVANETQNSGWDTLMTCASERWLVERWIVSQ